MQQVSCGPLEAKVQALKTRTRLSNSPCSERAASSEDARAASDRRAGERMAVGQAPIT